MSKFRKPSISYADVRRGAGTKKERALRASVLARNGETLACGPDEAEVEGDAKVGAASAPALTVVQNEEDTTARSAKDVEIEDNPSTGVAPQEGTGPESNLESDAEPKEEAPAAPKAPEDSDDEAAAGTKPRARRKASAPSKDHEPDLPQATKAGDDGTVYMEGYIHCPVPGRFDAFDKLVDAYGETRGVAAAISLGLKILEDCIATGKSVDPMLDYSTKKKRIKDRHTVDAAIAEWARANLDPAGILKHYTVSGRLWKTALGLYLAKG